MESRKITEEEIESQKTERGGWTRATLAAWGVSWPPPKGWKAILMQGSREDGKNKMGKQGMPTEVHLAKQCREAYIESSTDSFVEMERPGRC